jgi:hypothetical protein
MAEFKEFWDRFTCLAKMVYVCIEGKFLEEFIWNTNCEVRD